GTIDPVQADRQWAASTDQSKPRNSVTGSPRAPRAPGVPPESPAASAIEDGFALDGGAPRLASSYAASRAAREAYLARLAKLEFEQRSGKLVDADEVRAQVFGLGRRLRDTLMGLPDRLAPVLAGQTDH